MRLFYQVITLNKKSIFYYKNFKLVVTILFTKLFPLVPLKFVFVAHTTSCRIVSQESFHIRQYLTLSCKLFLMLISPVFLSTVNLELSSTCDMLYCVSPFNMESLSKARTLPILAPGNRNMLTLYLNFNTLLRILQF